MTTGGIIEPFASELRTLRADLDALQAKLQEQERVDRMSILLFSGDWDRIFATLVIATGAAAGGTEVVLFFTFWASAALRRRVRLRKPWIEAMFGHMLPRGVGELKLSRWHFMGLGRWLMGLIMRRHSIADLEQMLAMAEDLGVQLRVCEMSATMMGIREEELIPYKHLKICGVQQFLQTAAAGKITLFI